MISKLHVADWARLIVVWVDDIIKKLQETFDILRDQHSSNILKLLNQS